MTPDAPIEVRFTPRGRSVRVSKGTGLVDAALSAGIALDLPCGGEGLCGKCRMIVQNGASRPNSTEENALTKSEIKQGFRLACQTSVTGPMTVEVPRTSLLPAFHKILHQTTGGTRQTPDVEIDDPAVRKQYLELPPPGRDDAIGDLERLRRQIGPVEVDLDLARQIPRILRDEQFRGTAVIADGRLLDFEAGNTEDQCFAVALDLGTTTLVAVLLDARSGEELAVSAGLNPQTKFGDDVVSRIQHASDTADGLDQLNAAILETVDQMIGKVVASAGVERQNIYQVSVSGNTTMQQLLLGINPQYLGEVPFVPAVGRGVSVEAAKLPLDIHPRGRLYTLPVIGGFVGGDTVSGAVATGLDEMQGPSLLVDIGTNGEILLSSNGNLWAAATAAGPAFEGARILHGMRGSTGAMERVIIDDDVRIEVIGGGKPVGLCGSGLIDLAAELLRLDIISPQGRMADAGGLRQDLPERVRRRVVSHHGQNAFLLASEEESATGTPILLVQRDVRQLQLASGAIRAGILLLLQRAELQPADLTSLLIAGGFGNYIRRTNAQRIGLIPGGVPRDRIRYQGNTSLAGARLVALSQHAQRKAEELARQTQHIDLSTDPGFLDAFTDAMIFPDHQ
jgi:uncharacterized 2Fe-2S/4Fe-4S cluster protein (DUF4445 family)